MWTHSAFYINRKNEINFFFCLGWTLVVGILLYLCGFFHAFHWPQITWICLTTIGTVTALYRHGETITSTVEMYLTTLAIMLLIYIKGGAFQYLNQ